MASGDRKIQARKTRHARNSDVGDTKSIPYRAGGDGDRFDSGRHGQNTAVAVASREEQRGGSYLARGLDALQFIPGHEDFTLPGSLRLKSREGGARFQKCQNFLLRHLTDCLKSMSSLGIMPRVGNVKGLSHEQSGDMTSPSSWPCPLVLP